MKTLHFVHNIPAPYRIHLFNLLSKALARKNIKLLVHFMSNNNPNRPKSWTKSLEEADFEYHIWEGRMFRFNGGHYWLNLGLLKFLLLNRIDYLLVGGVWDNFTTLIASLLPISKNKYCWLELNEHVEGNTNKIILKVKSFLLNRFRKIVLPGRAAKNYVENNLDKNILNKILILPNLINESKFRYADEAGTLPEDINQFIKSSAHKLAFIPARLIPEKGLIEFFENTSDLFLTEGWNVLILGEGQLEKELKELLISTKLDQRVKICDSIHFNSVPTVYKRSSLFILPSLEDSNPLATIEALHVGLPMLISCKLGNALEAISEGINGYSFDPSKRESVREATSKILKLDNNTLNLFKLESQKIANKYWNSEEAVLNFVEKII